MRPKRCTPQLEQAFRWMAALSSTTLIFCPLAVTLTLSIGVTAMTEKRAPLGFQHLEQPQAWLCRTLPVISTSTLSLGQWQRRVPPVKLAEPLEKPLSMEGWREGAML